MHHVLIDKSGCANDICRIRIIKKVDNWSTKSIIKITPKPISGQDTIPLVY